MSNENEITNADETKNASGYKNMSAAEALKGINCKKIILPDIQRNFVWGMDDVIKLFDSIVAGFPIGSFIFWVTDKLSLMKKKPNLYYFEENLKAGDARNSKINIFEEGTYYIVLDGQQRLTAMYMAFYGTYTYYKGGKGHLRKYNNSWLKNKFYYNLDYHKDKDADEEHSSKMFCFADELKVDQTKYCKLDFLLEHDDPSDLEEYMDEQNFDEKCREYFKKIHKRLHDSSANSLVHYYCISEGKYDDALDIFVRVNSTGRKLSKSDLMFSTLIKDWKAGKEEIDGLLEEMNKIDGNNVFSFSRDYLMRLCLVLVDADTNLKIESFDPDTVNAITSNWKNIKAVAETMSLILKKLGFYHETLISYNATIPIAYYLYKGGKIVDDDDSEKEVRKFLAVCFVKRLFGFSGNAALNKTRDVLRAAFREQHPSFSLSLFKDVILTGDRTFNVGVEDIDKWLTYKKGAVTYALLSLLYSEIKRNFDYHQDHCHPYSKFDDDLIAGLGLTPEQEEDWRSKRDMLPNLQLMEGAENQSKLAEDLKVWASKPGNTVKYCSNDPSFLEFGNFENFFDERRKAMREEFAEMFDVTLSPANIDNPDQQQITGVANDLRTVDR